MKDFRMSDVPWNFSEDSIAEIFPELKTEQRAEAAENLSHYFRVVSEIYDELQAKGNLEEVLLRAQWEKRNLNKPASQNISQENDGTSNPIRESNESTS